MKAELILENIGSHRGQRIFVINSGKITVFEGSNSTGKSTIIKSTATALSSPITSENLISEANKFGILPRGDDNSPLVNIFEDNAKISLNYGEQNIEVILYKDGTIQNNYTGNEIFLYACMLVKNSKIQEYLASGNDDFYWIVSEMSNAGKYDELKDVLDAYVRESETTKALIKDINAEIGNYIEQNKALKIKRSELEKELNQVNEKIRNFDTPEIRKLNEAKEKLEEEKNKLQKQINPIKRDLTTNKSDLEKLNKKVLSADSKIDEEKEELIKFEKHKAELEKIDLDVTLEKRDKEKEKLEKLNLQQERDRVYKDMNQTLLNARLEDNICPICKSKITVTEKKVREELINIERRLSKIAEDKAPIRQGIIDLNQLIKDRNGINAIKILIKKKREKTESFETEKDKTAEKKKLLNTKIKSNETNLSQLSTKLKETENKIKDINKKLKENIEVKPFQEKEEELQGEIKKLDGNLEANKIRIEEKSKIEIRGIPIPIEKVNTVLNKLSNEYKKIDKYLIQNLNEQRQGAANAFNSTIKNIIAELGLDDFTNIEINNQDYRLRVERKGGERQPLGALGGAERGIIGGILQISCKQTYVKDIPFFIGDDIILEFDPEKRKLFSDYLKKLAEKEDLFVILTRISQDKELQQREE